MLHNCLAKSFKTSLRYFSRGRLDGQVALVTGGAQGIGRAIARCLSAEGAETIIADINETKGKETAQTIDKCHFIQCDTSDAQAIKSCFSEIDRKLGKLNILVNNASVFRFGHIRGEHDGKGLNKEVSEEDWETTINTNFFGYTRATEEAVKLMRRNSLTQNCYKVEEGQGINQINAGSKGSIVNVISVSGYIAQPSFLPYNMSKGALMQLTRCCALDFADLKIRVNGVCPGTIETAAAYNHMKLQNMSIEEGRKAFADSCMLKRQAAPEQVAKAVVFLASDDASFITGECLVVDGGGTVF